MNIKLNYNIKFNHYATEAKDCAVFCLGIIYNQHYV
jgi:hypothetical protein